MKATKDMANPTPTIIKAVNNIYCSLILISKYLLLTYIKQYVLISKLPVPPPIASSQMNLLS